MESGGPVISNAILARIENLPECNDSRFDIGGEALFELTLQQGRKRANRSEGDTCATTPKRKRLSLKTKEKTNRFELVGSPQREAAAKGVVPANTQLSNEWFLRNLRGWVEFRNSAHPHDLVPSNLLCSSDADKLCKWLCRYVQETRKEDGGKYPPSTIRQLLAAFQRREKKQQPLQRRSCLPSQEHCPTVYIISTSDSITVSDTHCLLHTPCSHFGVLACSLSNKKKVVLTCELKSGKVFNIADIERTICAILNSCVIT